MGRHKLQRNPEQHRRLRRQQGCHLSESDPFALEEDPDDFAIIFGPIHSLTGKTIYSSFVVYSNDIVKDLLPYESRILYGFLSINSENSAESRLGMLESAERFLPDDPEGEYFYVWKVARSNPNDEGYCLLVPEPTMKRITYDELKIGFRAYSMSKPLWVRLTKRY